MSTLARFLVDGIISVALAYVWLWVRWEAENERLRQHVEGVWRSPSCPDCRAADARGIW